MQPIIPEALEEEARVSRPPKRRRLWKKEDICVAPLPQYEHLAPEKIMSPIEYFEQMFSPNLLAHITFQINLYAKQRDVNTTFLTDEIEVKKFIGVLLYMGVCNLPAIEDYWANETRVPQVADMMSSKRFRLLRSLLHFNDNDQAVGSNDRFFKIRPVFDAITENFLSIPATTEQSVDEVMVAYKGTRAGNLRQYIKTKPDKWGYKLFCRGSTDGVIHDIIMYQGASTFEARKTSLSQEEQQMNLTSRIVISLIKTLKHPECSVIYADNFFSSIELAEYLKARYNCRYVGTARENRVGNPDLTPTKQMNGNKIPRGTLDYRSTSGIIVLKWKDNKVVNIISSDAGVEPMSTVKRYDKTERAKKEVPCPDVIKKYNCRMGGIDKSDMLTHLYKTPLRARRWYVKIFGYVIDLCVTNSWLVYKRDCLKLEEQPMPLKQFRLSVSRSCQEKKFLVTRSNSLSKFSPTAPKQQIVPSSCTAKNNVQHLPIFKDQRQTCKFCSKKGDIHRSRWMCTGCNVALCLNDKNNCFTEYHNENKL